MVEVTATAVQAAGQECEQALAQFLGTAVAFALQGWAQRRTDELAAAVAQLEAGQETRRTIVVGVYGPVQGYLVMLLMPQDAERIANWLLDGADDPTLRESALAEIGNLTTARLLMGLSRELRLIGEAQPTPPETRTDFSGALLESLVALMAAHGCDRVVHAVWQLQVQLPESAPAVGTVHFFLPL